MKPNLMTKPGHVKKFSTLEEARKSSNSRSPTPDYNRSSNKAHQINDPPKREKKVLQNFSSRMNDHAIKKEQKLDAIRRSQELDFKPNLKPSPYNKTSRGNQNYSPLQNSKSHIKD
jgi:hypothetical protein